MAEDVKGFTPGPWASEGPDQFGDYNIITPTAALAVAAVVSNLRPGSEVAANANLVAMAPSILHQVSVLKEALKKHARQCELLASAMRDNNRTGGWKGAETVAQAFDRQARAARTALSAQGEKT